MLSSGNRVASEGTSDKEAKIHNDPNIVFTVTEVVSKFNDQSNSVRMQIGTTDKIVSFMCSDESLLFNALIPISTTVTPPIPAALFEGPEL